MRFILSGVGGLPEQHARDSQVGGSALELLTRLAELLALVDDTLEALAVLVGPQVSLPGFLIPFWTVAVIFCRSN